MLTLHDTLTKIRACEHLEKFCEPEQASTHLIFASNSSKGQILRALSNWMVPFDTPPRHTLNDQPITVFEKQWWSRRVVCQILLVLIPNGEITSLGLKIERKTQINVQEPSECNIRQCRVLSNLSGEEFFLSSTEDWQVIYTDGIKNKTKETRLQKSYKISNLTGVTFICTNNFILHILALHEE